ncbi:hypothetical protein F4804DRAFT_347412 [Jackrogersella minutella]|nr:hypothetical protein F4804DRAFT_347412 [Jackrogersella minutella]
MYYPGKKAYIPRPPPLDLQSLHEAKTLFIKTCCGSRTQNLILDEGLKLFADLVEKRMLDYEDATTDVLNTLWVSHPETTYLERQFRTSTQIVSFIKYSDEQPTITDIAEKTFIHFGPSTTYDESHKNVMSQLVFAAIAWSTMLYSTKFDSLDGDSCTTTEVQLTHELANQSIPHAIDSAERPIGAMLRTRGLLPTAYQLTTISSPKLPTLLAVPHLNLYSLSQLGGVTITWTDELSKHCEFDRYGREKRLQMFRLPSLCAKLCLNKEEVTIIDQLFKSQISQQNSKYNLESSARSYLIEVLLSYRVLFGQHALSQRLFREKEREKAKWNGAVDPLLDALCRQEHVDGIDCIKELLHERGVYNADINFPYLGPRLLELADYSLSQRPRNLIEVWRDQRDFERFFTFRAVIIIGSVTIGLSILQIVVGIAQVAVSVRR